MGWIGLDWIRLKWMELNEKQLIGLDWIWIKLKLYIYMRTISSNQVQYPISTQAQSKQLQVSAWLHVICRTSFNLFGAHLWNFRDLCTQGEPWRSSKICQCSLRVIGLCQLATHPTCNRVLGLLIHRGAWPSSCTSCARHAALEFPCQPREDSLHCLG